MPTGWKGRKDSYRALMRAPTADPMMRSDAEEVVSRRLDWVTTMAEIAAHSPPILGR